MKKSAASRNSLRPSGQTAHSPLGVEVLEARTLLAVTATFNGGGGPGTLVINGDGLPNNIVVNRAVQGGLVVVTEWGANVNIAGGAPFPNQVVALQVWGNGGGDILNMTNVNFTKGFTNSLNGNVLLMGNNGADQVWGMDFSDEIIGGAGNDLLIGYNSADTIHGNMDNDQIWGGDENDQLYGDEGDDILWGELGGTATSLTYNNDSLSGGPDNDVLNGQSGNDYLAGDDVDIYWVPGESPTDGADSLYGGDGVPSMSLAGGDDWLWGSGKDDTLDASHRRHADAARRVRP